MGLSQQLFLYMLSSIACPSEPPPNLPLWPPQTNQGQKESRQQMLFFPESCIGRMTSADVPPCWRTAYPRQVSEWAFLGISAMCFVEFIQERDSKQWRPDDKEKTEERNPEVILRERLFCPSVMVNCGSYSLFSPGCRDVCGTVKASDGNQDTSCPIRPVQLEPIGNTSKTTQQGWDVAPAASKGIINVISVYSFLIKKNLLQDPFALLVLEDNNSCLQGRWE